MPFCRESFASFDAKSTVMALSKLSFVALLFSRSCLINSKGRHDLLQCFLGKGPERKQWPGHPDMGAGFYGFLFGERNRLRVASYYYVHGQIESIFICYFLQGFMITLFFLLVWLFFCHIAHEQVGVPDLL